MSLESALECYPKSIALKNGLSITMRPLVPTDSKTFGEFLNALPGEDLIFLKERVSDPKVVRRWCKEMDYGKALHLLAFHGKKIVGMALLKQDLGGWKRHVGRLNVQMLREYRGKGVGRNLTHDIIELARQAGLQWLEVELCDKQQPAVRFLGLLGFSHVLRLPDYVKDMHSVTHDYILMNMRLVTDEEYAGMG
jgi:GNAT superfamily N-acetyltransferase